MAKISGSIVLSTIRSFGRTINTKKTFSIQLLSSNLSADTTCRLQFSLDKTNWCNAQESGADVTFILANNTVLIKSFESDPELFWRILFDGVTTGTVNYIIN